MKKLLSLIGAFGLTATTSTIVVSCDTEKKDDSHGSNNNNNSGLKEISDCFKLTTIEANKATLADREFYQMIIKLRSDNYIKSCGLQLEIEKIEKAWNKASLEHKDLEEPYNQLFQEFKKNHKLHEQYILIVDTENKAFG